MRRTACGVLHTAYCILRSVFTPLCAACCINITEATDIEPHCSSRAFQAFVGNLSVPLSFHLSFLLQLCIGRLVLPCQSWGWHDLPRQLPGQAPTNVWPNLEPKRKSKRGIETAAIFSWRSLFSELSANYQRTIWNHWQLSELCCAGRSGFWWMVPLRPLQDRPGARETKHTKRAKSRAGPANFRPWSTHEGSDCRAAGVRSTSESLWGLMWLAILKAMPCLLLGRAWRITSLEISFSFDKSFKVYDRFLFFWFDDFITKDIPFGLHATCMYVSDVMCDMLAVLCWTLTIA